MTRLRHVLALAAVVAAASFGLSASPASAADQTAVACDPAQAAGLTWSTPSSLAWGREARIGANIVDPSAEGLGYLDGSVGLSVDGGTVHAASDPVDHDLEFVVSAPSSGSGVAANATWALTDATQTARCAQTAALSIPIGIGKILRFAARSQSNSIAWVGLGAGDCHEVALMPVSLTVQQGGVTRRLSATDQCHPAGVKTVKTADWELALSDGTFHLRALKTHSSLKTRMRYALRVGSRRVSSGTLALTRTYRPTITIRAGNPEFFNRCVHGAYKWINDGSTVGCIMPGVFRLRLAIA